MSTDSSIFLKEIHSIIGDIVSLAVNIFDMDKFTNKNLLGGNLTKNDVEALRTMHLNITQKDALKKLLIATSRLSASGILGLIDGIVMDSKNDLPDLQLINRNTGEDIAEDVMLNEEFYYLLDE